MAGSHAELVTSVSPSVCQQMHGQLQGNLITFCTIRPQIAHVSNDIPRPPSLAVPYDYRYHSRWLFLGVLLTPAASVP